MIFLIYFKKFYDSILAVTYQILTRLVLGFSQNIM